MKMKKLGLLLFFMIEATFAESFDRKMFDDVLKTLKEKSYHSLSDSEVYQAAIQGVLNHLEVKNKKNETPTAFPRPANLLLPPRSHKELAQEMEGEISGIGVGIEFDTAKGHKYPIITSIIKGGGAASAGLKEGDQILKIANETITESSNFRDLVYKIRGKSGTKVSLSLLRGGEILKKKVLRQKISWDATEVVEAHKNYSYIKIGTFNKKTVPSLKKELKSMKRRGAKSLILDLRGNSGGLFEEGLKGIGLFTGTKKDVLEIRYAGGKKKRFQGKSDQLAKGLKTIILIDRKTASMAEAFSKILRDAEKAQIIGEKSYGKGTIESISSLENGYSLKFTIGELYTLDGETWNRIGVKPDIEIPIKSGEEDYLLSLAKSLLQV